MSEGHEYRFKIDAFTPATLPMARLAEYMADLAIILGEPENVHFVRLEESSAVLVQRVDDVARPKVMQRVNDVLSGNAPGDAMKAFRRTNKRLKDDNCIASLSEDEGAEIIRFPGRDQEEPVSFGAFNQDGTLDGVVIVVGGTSDPVPVHLQHSDGTHNCYATREIAKTLGPYLFGPEVRVRGAGRWLRNEEGGWDMQRFTISSFEILDNQPLSAVVARLRDVPGSGWDDVEDPWGELQSLRHGPNETH